MPLFLDSDCATILLCLSLNPVSCQAEPRPETRITVGRARPPPCTGGITVGGGGDNPACPMAATLTQRGGPLMIGRPLTPNAATLRIEYSLHDDDPLRSDLARLRAVAPTSNPTNLKYG